MNRTAYEGYLSHFNTGDYEKVLSFWHEEFSCVMGDRKLFGSPAELRSFYSFLHEYAKEEVLIDHFLSGPGKIFMEARVRITGRKDLTQQIIEETGQTSLVPHRQGVVMEIPQFIHYHLRDGKFVSAVCLISAPPVVLGHDHAA